MSETHFIKNDTDTMGIMKKDYEAQYPAELYTKRPNETAILSPLYDWTFKQIFTQETDESNLALKSFLSAVLGRKITTVSVKNNEPLKETKKQKNMTFDVCVEFDDGEISDIELQSWKQNYDYGLRAEILVSRLLNNHAKRGKKWIAPKVYQISVLNFHYGKTVDGKSDNTEIKWYNMRNKQGNTLTDRLNIIFIDLQTIREKIETPAEQLTSIERWGLFFCYVDHEDKAGLVSDIIQNEEGIMAAAKIVRDMSKSDNNWYIQNSIWIANRDAYTSKENAREEGLAEGKAQGLIEGRAQGLAEGRVEGRTQGLAEGKEQQAIEAAINLLKMKKLSPEEIAQVQGLPLKKVLKLKKKHN